MNEAKYSDEFSRKTAIRLLRILSPQIKKLRDYKFDGGEEGHLIYKFHVPLLKHDPKMKGQVLLSLLKFCNEYNANLRFYVEDAAICIEVTVPKRPDAL